MNPSPSATTPLPSCFSIGFSTARYSLAASSAYSAVKHGPSKYSWSRLNARYIHLSAGIGLPYTLSFTVKWYCPSILFTPSFSLLVPFPWLKIVPSPLILTHMSTAKLLPARLMLASVLATGSSVPVAFIAMSCATASPLSAAVTRKLPVDVRRPPLMFSLNVISMSSPTPSMPVAGFGVPNTIGRAISLTTSTASVTSVDSPVPYVLAESTRNVYLPSANELMSSV